MFALLARWRILFWMGIRYRWATSLALLIFAIPWPFTSMVMAIPTGGDYRLARCLLLRALIYDGRPQANLAPTRSGSAC